MGEEKKEQGKGGAEKKGPGPNKAPGAPKAAAPQKDVNQCKFVDCKKKPEKFGFCTEHYELYMAGVVRGDGAKPIDFEQKLKWYQSQQQQRKAA